MGAEEIDEALRAIAGARVALTRWSGRSWSAPGRRADVVGARASARDLQAGGATAASRAGSDRGAPTPEAAHGRRVPRARSRVGARERTRTVTGPGPAPLRGQLDEHEFTSEALEATRSATRTSGRCGSTRRPRTPAARLCTSSRASRGSSTCGATAPAFRPTFLELLDEADVDARVVLVDAWTSVGGSQFVDSSGSGRYHTYLCEDVVPFVDARYETNGLRGVAGKSSGGYGAAVTAMLRPDLFSGFASHAGGGLFEVSIRPFFRVAARRLRDAYGGSVERFLDELHTGPARSLIPTTCTCCSRLRLGLLRR